MPREKYEKLEKNHQSYLNSYLTTITFKPSQPDLTQFSSEPRLSLEFTGETVQICAPIATCCTRGY